MKSNRLSLMTFSMALGGLFVLLLSPQAHGHGNNPKTDNTALPSDDPPGGPGYPLGPNYPDPTSDDPIDSWQPDEPGWVTVDDLFDPSNPDPGPGPDQGVDALILGGSAPIDVVADQNLAFEFDAVAPLGGQEGTGFSGPVSSAASGAIPTPGTLALLGLAALTFRRRRRT